MTTQSTGETRRPWNYALRALVGIVLLLAAVLLLMCYPWKEQEVNVARPDELARRATAESPHKPDQYKQSSGRPKETSQISPASVGNTAKEGAESASTTRIVIRLHTQSGGSVRGIGVEYTHERVAEYVQRRSPASREGHLKWQSATTDRDGCLVVELKDSDVPGILLVRPLSMIWRLAGDGYNLFRRDIPDAASYEVTQSTKHVSVEVERSMRILLDVRYSDGQPFVGHVHLTFWTQIQKTANQAPKRDLGNLELDLDGSAQYIDIPEDTEALTVNTVGYRFGWVNPYGIDVSVDVQARSLSVLVPEGGEPRGGVCVNLSGINAADGWELRMSGEANWSPVEPPKWGREYRNYTLIPGFQYIVRISGPLGVWESDTFSVGAGEVFEFDPQITAPVSVRLRVVNQKGEPVFPSYVTTRFHGMPDWRLVRSTGGRLLANQRDGAVRRKDHSKNGEDAPGDTEGVVTLSGIPQEVNTLYVEAEGYERTVVRLSAMPGVHVDLGDVVVAPAKGQITVKFTNMTAGEKFLVDVSKPRRGAGESQTTDGTDTHVFSGLSVNRGTYVVRAFRPGLAGYQVLVTLTDEQPAAEIEIDASKIPRDGPRVETETAPGSD